MHVNKHVLYIILIVVAGFGVYANALNGAFVWDDQRLIVENAYIKDIASLPRLFTQNLRAGAGREGRFYRPLQAVTYMLDYAVWKSDVRGYHLTSIVLHILTALVFYWLLTLLFQDRLLSFFASLLFVVHPLHTEAVTYISGRADPLSGLFILLSLLLYVGYNDKQKLSSYLLMLLTYALALLSRESALILPVLVLVWCAAFKKKINGKAFLSLIAVSLAYLLARAAVPGPLSAGGRVVTGTLFQRLPGIFAAISDYLRLFFLPLRLHMEYGFRFFAWSEAKVLFGCAAAAVLLFTALRKREKDPLVFFSLAWFFVTLFPQSGIIPLNAYMAEHWMYLPSLGLCMLIAGLLTRLYRRKKAGRAAIVIVLLVAGFYSFLTVKQNTYWRRPEILYKRILTFAPQSARVLNNLGRIYTDRGEYDKALESLHKALEADPGLYESYYNLGNAYSAMGKVIDAVLSYQKALALKPDFAKAQANLGVVLDETGDYQGAIAAYKKAIELKPDYAMAYGNLGVSYENLGEEQQAIAAYKKALALDPGLASVYYNLASLLIGAGREEEAKAYYRKAVELDPRFRKMIKGGY